MVLLKSLSLLPVKPKDAKGMFSDELAAVLRSGFDAIQPFYLQFGSLNQACTDALLNILMLNYDQFLELDGTAASIGDALKIKTIERQTVKEVYNVPAYKDGKVISDDMRLFTLDIIFKKK